MVSTNTPLIFLAFHRTTLDGPTTEYSGNTKSTFKSAILGLWNVLASISAVVTMLCCVLKSQCSPDQHPSSCCCQKPLLSQSQ